jgi:transcription initiation factor TFIID subunit TAF12
MAGRDLFANKSPQYLQQIGSNHPKVKEWTMLEKLQGVQNTPQGVTKDAEGNEYDTATGQRLVPINYKAPEVQQQAPQAVAQQPQPSMPQANPQQNPLVAQIQAERAANQPKTIQPESNALKLKPWLIEEFGRPNEMGAVKDMYAGGKALVDDATSYGSMAINSLFDPKVPATAENEDKLRQR